MVISAKLRCAIHCRVPPTNYLPGGHKIAVMSYHFPWPGCGHVVKNGNGFRYIAEPMVMTL
jgi:hypothetical protein